VALTSEVTTLKDHNLKLANQAKTPKNKGPRGKTKGGGKYKQPSKKASDKENLAWKKVPPQEGEPQSKQMTGRDKEHHSGEDHHAWMVHTPAPCTFRIAREEAAAAQALAAVLDGFESDE
jgi:hypothetical protein